MQQVKKPELPKTRAEVPEWRRQLHLYLEAQKAEIAKAVEQRKKFLAEQKQIADIKLAQAEQEYKAAEDQKAAALQKLSDLRNNRGKVAEQRQQQLKEVLQDEHRKLVEAKCILEVLKQKLEEHQETAKTKIQESADRAQAMRTIKKLYTNCLQLDLNVDEEKEILNLKFVFVDDDRKVREYTIQLKEITRKLQYELVNPKPEILKVVGNNHIITNIGKALYEIREFLLNNKDMGKYRE